MWVDGPGVEAKLHTERDSPHEMCGTGLVLSERLLRCAGFYDGPNGSFILATRGSGSGGIPLRRNARKGHRQALARDNMKQ